MFVLFQACLYDGSGVGFEEVKGRGVTVFRLLGRSALMLVGSCLSRPEFLLCHFLDCMEHP